MGHRSVVDFLELRELENYCFTTLVFDIIRYFFVIRYFIFFLQVASALGFERLASIQGFFSSFLFKELRGFRAKLIPFTFTSCCYCHWQCDHK